MDYQWLLQFSFKIFGFQRQKGRKMSLEVIHYTLLTTSHGFQYGILSKYREIGYFS
jgi:hypothetical protein